MELDGKTLISPPPTVEVELVHEPARPGLGGRAWCALQVWTQNRIYDVDWGMRCFGVTDRESGEPSPGHRLLGAHLAGGQVHGETALELTYPIPRPGVTAVFEVGEHPKLEYVMTSEVTRVVLRLRVFSVPDVADAAPKWQELGGLFRLTRPGYQDPNRR